MEDKEVGSMQREPLTFPSSDFTWIETLPEIKISLMMKGPSFTIAITASYY